MTARLFCRSAIILLCGFASIHAVDTLKYQLIDLGYQIKAQCQVLGMNNRNQVVGYALMSNDGIRPGTLRRGFVWTNSTFTTLEPLVYGGECIAEAINDSGVVVGYAYTTPYFTGTELSIHACMWKNGKISDLSRAGEIRSAAFDINNNGTIAGFLGTQGTSQGYVEHVFRRQGDSVQILNFPQIWPGLCSSNRSDLIIGRNDREFTPQTLLGTTSWTLADEICINDRGDVVGSFVSSIRMCHGFLWRKDDTTTMLMDPNSRQALHPQDINNSGQITGFFISISGTTVSWSPSLWQDNNLISLQTPFGITVPCPPYINNLGDLVGTSYASGGSTPIIWRIGEAIDLNDLVERDVLKWHLETAMAINDSGAIAGNSLVGGYIAIPKPPKFSMPQRGAVQVTLTEASASLESDIYLFEPDTILIIANNLKNVGIMVDTIYEQGSQLVFGIRVHRNGQTYDHPSNSKYAKTTRISESVYTIAFEDLPDSLADWDYNDVVIRVEVLNMPSEAGPGVRVAKVQHPSVLVKGNKLAVITENIQNLSVCDLKGGTQRLAMTHVAGNSWVVDLSGLARGTYVARLNGGAKGAKQVVRTFAR